MLAEKLDAALEPATPVRFTRRDARLSAVPGKVHSVIGMRRSGKTTFLLQLPEARRAEVAAERALYLSFDDDRLAGIGVEQLGSLLEECYRAHPALRGRVTADWFLDEIQLVPGWERFARRLLDTERIELVVSGSSARLLPREVHTSLRGISPMPSCSAASGSRPTRSASATRTLAGEELIQVCADVTAEATLGRELRALDAAGLAHRRAARPLLGLDRDSAARVDGRVRVEPAYEWLLVGSGEG